MKKRLGSLLGNDIRFAWRHGFYWVYIALTAAYALILRNIPETAAAVAAPLFVYSDPSVVGMMFMGAIVMLERQQGVLDYTAVTPVTAGEYLLSKTLSLTLVSVFASVLLMVLGLGGSFSWVLLLPGIIGTAVFHILLGAWIALRSSTLNGFIMLCVPFVLMDALPAAPLFQIPYTGALKALPGWGGLAFLVGSVRGMTGPAIIASLISLVVWCAAMAWLTQRAFSRTVMKGGRS